MTIDALLPIYRALLALHVISVIIWMSGMIMLPVIYARHVTGGPNAARDAAFVELEHHIIKRFVNPAMYAAWGFGALLVLTPGTVSWTAAWWLTKLAAVLVLSGFHGALSAWRRGLRDGANRHDAAFFQGATLVPIALVMLIVPMVIIKP
jgi:putative membrane protein